MSKNLPNISLKVTKIHKGVRNIAGQLQNAYTPFLNLADGNTKKLGDFTTEQLNFDLQHPVDIICQDAYDGAVNLILNDGKNKPRLINSRFSILDENTFKIPDHSGFKDTNIYDEETFEVDTHLKAIPKKIPVVTFKGLQDNAGTMQSGLYTFYFKLADADGNETEVVAESSIVQCHIGTVNDPFSMRMGMENENSNKAIKFTLSNIENGFDFVHVLYSRTSSSNDQSPITTYHKILFDFPTSKEGICDITITGSENHLGTSKEECEVDYADINSVKTQTINSNILLFGNLDTPEHDWDAIKQFTWRIIPRYKQLPAGSIGSLDSSYKENLSSNIVNDYGYCYYNTKNVYYHVGYWPDEIYRFGIVYIFEDNSLSPVINLQGIDFSLVDQSMWAKSSSGTTEYEKLFFEENTGRPCYLYEDDSLYFNKKYRTNSRGVIKFPRNIDVINTKNGIMTPRPLYLELDFHLIGCTKAGDDDTAEIVDWTEIFKKHKIKGYFITRQKRIPTILGQGITIGLSDKERGSLPVIQNNSGQYVVQPFLNKDRLLQLEAQELAVNGSQFEIKAMLCPDAEVNEATYNQLFVSSDYSLDRLGNLKFAYQNKTASPSLFVFDDTKTEFKTKLLNIPEDTKILTNGKDYFSTLAGSPHEPYKTKDIIHVWNHTLPQDLTESTSLLRGQWGPFVGLNNPTEGYTSPLKYGDVYNIKTLGYCKDAEEATDLDFFKVMNSNDVFYTATHREEIAETTEVFRGDCFISLFTHRMFRNFYDPEQPTNDKIIDPGCWAKNYGVRCSANIEVFLHSNLTDDTSGWYLSRTPYSDAIPDLLLQAVLRFFSLDFVGWGYMLKKISEFRDLAEQEPIDISKMYPNGYANEIVQAFEVYKGDVTASNTNTSKSDLEYTGVFSGLNKPKAEDADNNAYYPGTTTLRKKKVNPQEQEADSGFSFKKLFKSSENWSLRGLANINRGDVNAVAMGQWITFPICSNKNLAFRDVDYSNATEEAMFNRKRSFYPLFPKDIHNKLRDSNVLNQAAGIALPVKQYFQLPKVPYYKQEYFTRILNSFRDNADSITNQFKIMLESAYQDYTKIYGSITKLESRGDYVYIIFKHGIGILPFAQSQSLAKDATGFLPPVSIMSDTYGSIWKDSIIQTPTGIYGIDSVAKVIWKILNDQFMVLSDMKVGKFLVDNLKMSEFEFMPYIGHINIKTHYNAFKHDVIFTYYHDSLYKIVDGNKELLLPHYDKEKGWIQYLDIIKEIEEEGASYMWESTSRWSLCYNEDLLAFQTFYDWIPLESENIDNIYFSFDKDGIDEMLNPMSVYLARPHFYLIYTSLSPRTKETTLTKKSDPAIQVYKDLNINTGTLEVKKLIDNSFSNKATVYHIKNYNKLLTLGTLGIKYDIKPLTLEPEEVGVFSAYIKNTKDEEKYLSFVFKCNNFPNQRWRIQIDNNWTFYYWAIKNTTTHSITINELEQELSTSNFVTYDILEPKLIKYQGTDITFRDSNTNISTGFIKGPNGKFTSFYDLRSADNSMKLWKHGQAGIYDNQGKIKPTNWYGKQHEFYFEFIVNKSAIILKIFNNLKIISNKVPPYKFEYEVVGESYMWFEYKAIVQWINQKVKDGIFTDLSDGYFYVLNNNLGDIQKDYSDFPELWGKSPSYIIPQLPYLKIKLSDKEGLVDNDKSYTKKDKWYGMTKKPSNDYNFNSNETILVEDPQLNEIKLHTEQLGNDMKKYGRIRGNMEYLEDLWDIEIRPIYFTWVYKNGDELSQSTPKETRLRDKYIKIKVRYTGEDLVIIQAIQTMFDYSFA